MSEMTPVADRASHIDCYEAEFPAGDPQSAIVYPRLVLSAFDMEFPSRDGEPFSATTEIFLLPDVTVSWAKVTASRFTRSVRTIAAHTTD